MPDLPTASQPGDHSVEPACERRYAASKGGERDDARILAHSRVYDRPARSRASSHSLSQYRRLVFLRRASSCRRLY